MRYELTDDEWTAIRPMLPNKPRGMPRVNDRRVLNGPPPASLQTGEIRRQSARSLAP
jgi:transposase